MGRTVADDPVFFLAAGAAGVLAGRMAAGSGAAIRRDAGRESAVRRHMWAISCSTRSSTLRNGSLHSTVRCAWSFSLRCTQSTV